MPLNGTITFIAKSVLNFMCVFFSSFFRFVINKRAIKLNAHGDIEAIIDEKKK